MKIQDIKKNVILPNGATVLIKSGNYVLAVTEREFVTWLICTKDNGDIYCEQGHYIESLPSAIESLKERDYQDSYQGIMNWS